jgi:hypothetical protein
MLRSATAQMLPPRPPSPPFGPAEGDELLAPEAHAAAPPLPAATSIVASSMNFMVHVRQPATNEKAPARPGLRRKVREGRSGRGHEHRLAVLRALDVELDTVPSTSANSVWSRPMPTLVPAWNLVPRWRTMIEPADTSLAAEHLHAQHLRLGVAAVAG